MGCHNHSVCRLRHKRGGSSAFAVLLEMFSRSKGIGRARRGCYQDQVERYERKVFHAIDRQVYLSYPV